MHWFRLCVTHSVLVKQLSTIETVGSMSMLASDKTGTLTQNKMTVSDLITADLAVEAAQVCSILPAYSKYTSRILSAYYEHITSILSAKSINYSLHSFLKKLLLLHSHFYLTLF